MSKFQIDQILYIKAFDEYICPDGNEDHGYLNRYREIRDILEKLNISDARPKMPYFTNVVIGRFYRKDEMIVHETIRVPVMIYTKHFDRIVKAAGGIDNVKIGNPPITLDEALEIQGDRKTYETKVVMEHAEMKDVRSILKDDHLCSLKILSDISDSLRIIANALANK